MAEHDDSTYQRLIRFCTYQERCTSDVIAKCHRLDLDDDEIDEMLSRLKEEDYLNDLRFARSFVSGKFRIKRWGKVKIRSKLIEKKVNSDLIYEALNEIDEEQYLEVMGDLISMKKREKGPDIDRDKLFRFLAGRGFEFGLISEHLNEHLKS